MTEKMFYNVEDVMEIMKIKSSTAYKIIAELNKELENKKVKTQKGVINAEYFKKRVYI